MENKMLGDVLKELRESNNLQQIEIANFLQVAKSTYSQYEGNKSRPAYEILIKLAKFYNVSVDYLLGIEDDENRILTIEESQKMIKEELGDGIEIRFRKEKDLTPAKIKTLKKIVEAYLNEED